MEKVAQIPQFDAVWEMKVETEPALVARTLRDEVTEGALVVGQHVSEELHWRVWGKILPQTQQPESLRGLEKDLDHSLKELDPCCRGSGAGRR